MHAAGEDKLLSFKLVSNQRCRADKTGKGRNWTLNRESVCNFCEHGHQNFSSSVYSQVNRRPLVAILLAGVKQHELSTLYQDLQNH